jgi:hypothetical protein
MPQLPKVTFKTRRVPKKLVLDRVPFNSSGFGVLLKPEPDSNQMFATRNFTESFIFYIIVRPSYGYGPYQGSIYNNLDPYG